MVRNSVKLILGMILTALVIFLAFDVEKEIGTILLVIGTSFIAPVGMTLITDFLNRNKEKKMDDLLMVGEIDKLINNAKSEELKVKLLEEQRNNIAIIVEYETRKTTLEERKKYLKKEIINNYKELKDIDRELLKLDSQLNELDNKRISDIYQEVMSDETISVEPAEVMLDVIGVFSLTGSGGGTKVIKYIMKQYNKRNFMKKVKRVKEDNEE